MAEGLRLEDWIGKRVTVNIPLASDPDERIVSVEGYLEGVDPVGIFLLFGLGDVHTGSISEPFAQPDVPRHVFYPWSRVHLIERIEAEADEGNFEVVEESP